MWSKVAMIALLVVVFISAIGCATIFYPERTGQPAYGGRLDAGMFLLDIFFFWPFSWLVDFMTGAIWMPPGY